MSRCPLLARVALQTLGTGLSLGLFASRASTVAGAAPSAVAKTSSALLVAVGVAIFFSGRVPSKRRRAALFALSLLSAATVAFPAPALHVVGFLADLGRLDLGLREGLLFLVSALAGSLLLAPQWLDRRIGRLLARRPALFAPIGLLGASSVILAWTLPPEIVVLCPFAAIGCLGSDDDPPVAHGAREASVPDSTAWRRVETLIVFASAFAASLATFTSWTAARASLDPTPWAFSLSLALVAFALLAVASLPWAIPIPDRRESFWMLLFAALSALFGIAGPRIALAGAARYLPAQAGLESARPILTGLLVLASLLPVLPMLVVLSGRRTRVPWIALLLGGALGFGLAPPDGQRAFWILTVTPLLGGVGMVVASRRVGRLAGLVVAGLASLAIWKLDFPVPSALALGWASRLRDAPTLARSEDLRSRSDWKAISWGPDGTSALRRLGPDIILDADGVPVERTGRFAAATRFAADLAMLSSPDPERVLVLGDDIGLATTELLAWKPGSISSCVAQPALLRALAEEDPDLGKRLLHPTIRLRSVPSPLLLSWSGRYDAILQVVRQAWPDATGQPPDGPFFAQARAHLAPGGVYVALLSLERLAPDRLGRLTREFLSAFPQGTGWFPPEGVDALLLVGRDDGTSVPFARLAERFAAAPDQLKNLGFTEPVDVAEKAAFDASALSSLAETPLLRTPRLPACLFRPHTRLLAHASARLTDPAILFGLDTTDARTAELRGRQARVQHFLDLLARSEAGDISSLLGEAQALDASDQRGQSLDDLIAPQLAMAREALSRSKQEGPLSSAWGEAENALNVALLVHPRSTDALLLLSALRESRGDPNAAENGYQKVLSLDPASLEALFGLARVRERRGNLTGAEEALRSAVRNHPQRWEAHQNLGVLLLHENRLDDAEAALRKAAGLSDATESAPNAGLAEVFLAQGRPAAALVEAERATRLAPTAYHYFLRGRANFELRQMDRAEQDFQKSVLVDPEFYLSRGALGQIFAARGDYDQASEAFRAVLARDPGNVAARLNLKTIEEIRAKMPPREPKTSTVPPEPPADGIAPSP